MLGRWVRSFLEFRQQCGYALGVLFDKDDVAACGGGGGGVAACGGGGGGMDVGEGLIHQSTIGTRISLSQKFDITIDIGRMKGVDGGSFAANVLQVGVSF